MAASVMADEAPLPATEPEAVAPEPVNILLVDDQPAKLLS